MDRWRGKNAVVTGAASGIGAAITHRLLEASINVVGLDLQVERLAERKRELENSTGKGKLYPLRCDLACEKDLEHAFNWVERELGGVAIMVNNAGVVNYTPVIESNRETFERLININVLAPASCIVKAARSMRAKKTEGHIFNITSVLGHEIPERTLSSLEGLNGWNLYPASKHAVVAMTQTVRRELSRAELPIRITSISPGLVKTEITKNFEALKDLFDSQPALDPTDIADGLMYALGTRPEVQISEMTIDRSHKFHNSVAK